MKIGTPFIVLWLSRLLLAIPEQNLSFDFGAGAPQLVALQGQVRTWERVQLGASYGMLPGSGLITVPFPDFEIKVVEGVNIYAEPKSVWSMYSLSPYFRFFPSKDRNFYLQFMWVFLRTKADITMKFKDSNQAPLVDAVGAGTVTFTKGFPTFSLGMLFASKLFFVNFTVGFSILATVSSDVSATVLLPDSIGGGAASSSVMETIKAQLNDSASEMASEFRSRYPILPSVMISMGLLL